MISGSFSAYIKSPTSVNQSADPQCCYQNRSGSRGCRFRGSPLAFVLLVVAMVFLARWRFSPLKHHFIDQSGSVNNQPYSLRPDYHGLAVSRQMLTERWPRIEGAYCQLSLFCCHLSHPSTAVSPSAFARQPSRRPPSRLGYCALNCTGCYFT